MRQPRISRRYPTALDSRAPPIHTKLHVQSPPQHVHVPHRHRDTDADDAHPALGDHALCQLAAKRQRQTPEGRPRGRPFFVLPSPRGSVPTATKELEPVMTCKTYVTTAIPFVNASPHIGHALELVITDALARHARQRGASVRCQTGTDDNSLKNALAAERLGIPTAELVAHHAAEFANLGKRLGFHPDDFIRTSSDPRHSPAVIALWKRCAAAGDIYKRNYSGLYCVGCEHFLAVEELDGAGCCPEHRIAPEPVSEENYFFRLSRYQDFLLGVIDRGVLRIEPAERRAEVRAFIASGLRDLSISRSRERARGWGIPVPDDPEQIIYVWFDALTNYVSALGWPSDGGEYSTYWRGPSRRAHVIGKGVVRFHAVYWPAILRSASLPLPSEILSHGYVTADGQKIGKSLGNGIDPTVLIDRYGCDSVRYFLLRHIHTTKDGDISSARLVQAHNAELADQLGNLAQRVTALVARERHGQVPAPSTPGTLEHALAKAAAHASDDVARGFDTFALHKAASALFRFVTAANRYADQTAPWSLAKRSGSAAQASLDTVLYHLVESLRVVAILALPFIPESAIELATRVGLQEQELCWDALAWGTLPVGTTIYRRSPLFPKVSPEAPHGIRAERNTPTT